MMITNRTRRLLRAWVVIIAIGTAVGENVTTPKGATTTAKPTPGPSTPTPPENPPRAEAFKFRVCSASATGELFRFNLEKTCPGTEDKTHQEGILMVFKKNIVPHIFKVRRYRKVATSVTVYRGWTETAVTGKQEVIRPVPQYEINHMDTTYQCFSSMRVNVNGIVNTYTDRDFTNQTVFLQPVEGLTDNIQRYFSQPVLYTTPGWFPGIYRVRTTVNCEIVDMIARSAEPYSYFVTALGDTVEVSPFCHNDSTCSVAEKTENGLGVRALTNYTIVDFATRKPTTETRVFADSGEYTVSWKAEDPKSAVCALTLWKTFPRAIQTTHEASYHFVANDVTATFTSPLSEVANFTGTYSCLDEVIQKTLNDTIKKLSDTHVTNGSAQYYKTEGGLFLLWQPLTPLSLVDEMRGLNGTTPAPPATTSTVSRVRRSVNTNEQATDNLAAPQLQFAYDKLRASINKVLEELSRAWCREQVRDTYMWYELSKINPTSVMTAIYGRPVSAKFVGDAISVTDCVAVDQASVSIHKSLRTSTPGMCYSRPPVTFRFLNSTTLFKGQLGPRNEIILTDNQVEACKETCEHYFIASNVTYYYKDYVFVKKINTSEISTLGTFIALNLSFIENIDFRVIELYSRAEKKLSGSVFDIETMFREYNYYTQRLAGLREDLDNTIDLNRDRLARDLSEIVADLGDVGRTVVNVASSVITLFGSIVSGFINFIKSPFGGMLMILVIVAVVLIVFALNRRTNAIAQAPIRMIYPDIDKMQPSGGKVDQEQIKNILAGMHQLQQEERRRLDEQQRSAPSLFRRASDGLKRRFRGYKPLENEEAQEYEMSK
ncbi:ORF 8 [Macacine gammaherpesvirus 5]|uniref:ORF08 n=1 Tax=Rhesus monkey rhadinovirus H26-95 TaxID=69256 RepID=Q9J2M4_9GAMA|nr:ORF08 [Rhesus monkey rhadinovirus H26-95]QFN51605.1 ORF 8 [Macacine gammaherpesvirus 5]